MPANCGQEGYLGDLAIINAAVLATLAIAHAFQQSVGPDRPMLAYFSVNLLFLADLLIRKKGGQVRK